MYIITKFVDRFLDCGEIIVAQQVIPKPDHDYEIVPAVPATYTKTGSTQGVRCKVCGEWPVEPNTIF